VKELHVFWRNPGIFFENNFSGVDRIHRTLRVTPAMAAGISTPVWEIEDLRKLID
jgi:hypothetical protein